MVFDLTRWRGRPLYFLVALAVLAPPLTEAAPTPNVGNICKAECTTGKSGFNYEVGKAYIYNLETTATTTKKDVTNDEVKTTLRTKATIQPITPCLFAVTLDKTSINSETGVAFKDFKNVEKGALTFSLNDGEISNVCGPEADPIWIANIKWAIAGLIQSKGLKEGKSSIQSEKDLQGDCPTDYEVEKKGDKVVVNKHRDLNNCRNRDHRRSTILGAPYKTQGSLTSSPTVDSTLECQQDIRGGIIQTVSCVERYRALILAGPSEDSGTRTVVNTKLTLKETAKAEAVQTAANKPLKRKVLDFKQDSIVAVDAKKLADILIEFCKDTEITTPEGTATKFADVIYPAIRGSKKDDILKAFGDLEKSNCKKVDRTKQILHTTLIRAGTEDSVAAYVDEVKKGKVNDAVKLVEGIEFNFITYPTKGSLKAITPLVDKSNPGPSKEVILGAGGIASRYCHRHSDCASAEEYQTLIKKIASHLHECKPKEPKEDIEVVSVLKALSDVPALPDDVVEKIKTCITDKTVTPRIRVYAIEAFRGSPCNKKLKKTALELFQSKDEDSEIRITAYLQLWRCPCEPFRDIINQVLKSVCRKGQVGAFVSSHIRALQSTQSGHKTVEKALANTISVPKYFISDALRFSQHIEMSNYNSKIDLGSSAEGNIIFSENSFVPKRLGFNVSLDAFGQNINVLEIDARINGIEGLLKRMFGPEGLLPKNSATFKDIWEFFLGKAGDGFRKKRAIEQADIDAIHKQVQLGSILKNKEIDIDLTTRIGGSTVANWINLPNEFDGTKDEKNILPDQKGDWGRGMLWLEHTSAVATAGGLPIKYKLLVASVFTLEWDVTPQLPDTLVNVKVRLGWSSDSRVFVTIPTPALENGLEYSFRTRINKPVFMGINRKGANGFQYHMNHEPLKEHTVAIASSNGYRFERQGQDQVRRTPVKPLSTEKREIVDCWVPFKKIFDHTICTKLSLPKTQTTMMVPSEASLTFKEEGPLLITLEREPTDQGLKGIFKIESPTSKTHKKTLIKLAATFSPTFSELKVHAVEGPYGTGQLKAALTTTDKLNQVELIAELGSNINSLKAGLTTDQAGPQSIYAPFITIKTPASGKVNLIEGKLTKDGDSKYKVDIKTAGKIKGLVLKGLLENNSIKGENLKLKLTNGELILSTGKKLAVKGNGHLEIDENGIDSSISLNDGKKESIEYKTILKDRRAGDKANDNIDIILLSELRNTLTPSINHKTELDLKFDLDFEKHDSKGHLIIITGEDLDDPKNKIQVDHNSKYIASSTLLDLESKTKVSWPKVWIDSWVDIAAKSNNKEVNGAIDIQWDPKITAKGKIQLDRASGKGNAEAQLKSPAKSIDLKLDREQLAKGKSKYTGSLALQPGRKYESTAIITNINNRPALQHHELSIETKAEGIPDPFKLDIGDKAENQKKWKRHLKLEVGGQKQIDIEQDLDWESVTDFDEKIKGEIKDYLAVNFNAKSVPGKLSADTDILLKKSNQKILSSLEVVRSGIDNDVKFDLKWDANKNPEKKITFVSKTSLDSAKHTLASKSELNIIKLKTEIDINGNLKPSEGKVQGQISQKTTLPSGKTIESQIQATAIRNKKEAKVEGDIKIKTSTDKTYELRLNSDLKQEGSDKTLNNFNYIGELAVKTPHVQGVSIKTTSNVIQPDLNKADIQATLVIGGDSIKKPISISGQLNRKNEDYKLIGSAAFGNKKAELKSNGKIHVTETKSAANIDVTLDIPWTTVKQIKFITDTKLDSTSLQNFKFHETSELSLGSDVVKSATVVEWNARRPALKVNYKTSGSQYDEREIGVEYIVSRLQGTSGRALKTGVVTKWAGNKEYRIDLTANRDPEKESHATLTVKTPIKNYESGNIIASHVHQTPDSSTTEVEINCPNGRQTKLLMKNKQTKNERELDVALTDNQSQLKPTLHASLIRKGQKGGAIKIKADWGNGGYVNGEASVVRGASPLDLEATTKLDSPAINIKQLDASWKSKVTGEKIKVDGQAALEGKTVWKIDGTYERNPSTPNQYKGLVIVQVEEKKATVTANMEIKEMTSTNLEILANGEISSDDGKKATFTYDYKHNENEVREALRVKADDFEQEIDISAKDNSKGLKWDYQYSAHAKVTHGGKTRTYGTKSVFLLDGLKLNNLVEIDLNTGANEAIGYRIYAEDDDAGAIVQLFGRKLGVTATTKSDATCGAQNKNSIKIIAALDLSAPKDGLVICTIAAPSKDAHHGQGFEVKSTVELPKIKPIVATGELHLYGKHSIAHSKLELDIFEKIEPLKVEYLLANNDIKGGKNLTSVLTVKGLPIVDDSLTMFIATSNTDGWSSGIIHKYLSSKGPQKAEYVLAEVTGIIDAKFIVQGADKRLITIERRQVNAAADPFEVEALVEINPFRPINLSLKSNKWPGLGATWTATRSGKQLQIRSGLTTDKKVIYDIRVIDDKTVIDLAGIRAELDKSNELKSEVIWNEKAIEENILESAIEIVKAVADNAKEQTEVWIEDRKDEITQRLKKIPIAEFTPVKNSLKEQLEKLEKELETKKPYKEIEEIARVIFKFIDIYVRDALEKLQEWAEKGNQQTEKWISEAKIELKKLAKKLNELWIEAIRESKEIGSDLLDRSQPALKAANDLIHLTALQLKAIIEAIADPNSPLSSLITNAGSAAIDIEKALNPWIKAAVKDTTETLEAIVALTIKEGTDLINIIDTIVDDIATQVQKTLVKLLKLSRKAIKTLDEQIKDSDDVSKEIKDLIENLVKAIDKAIEAESIDLKDIDDILNKAIVCIVKGIKLTGIDLEGAAPDIVEIVLGSLNQQISYSVPNVISTVEFLIHLIADPWIIPLHPLTYWYYANLSIDKPISWLPPLPGHALITKSKIVTFDGQKYSFENAKCQYILAADFWHDGFSLAIDYGDNRAITLSDESGSIRLNADNSIVESSKSADSTLTSRRVWNGQSISSPGITITCDHGHNMCSVVLDGYMFGHTRGILGTFNNERCDDYTTITGEVVKDPVAFAKTWKLKKSCDGI